jgi:hypothetical protein
MLNGGTERTDRVIDTFDHHPLRSTRAGGDKHRLVSSEPLRVDFSQAVDEVGRAAVARATSVGRILLELLLLELFLLPKTGTMSALGAPAFGASCRFWFA